MDVATIKITEMPNADQVRIGDDFTLVRDGANYRANKELILTGGIGEPIGLFSSEGQEVLVGVHGTFGAELLMDDATGLVALYSQTGININCDTANGIVLSCPQGVYVSFQPLNPGNWAFAPVSQAEAIDRIAAAVAGLLGGPIP